MGRRRGGEGNLAPTVISKSRRLCFDLSVLILINLFLIRLMHASVQNRDPLLLQYFSLSLHAQNISQAYRPTFFICRPKWNQITP